MIKVTVARIGARSSARAPRSVVVRVPGPQGPAGTTALGTVTVVNPDQNPAITASGTARDRVFNFNLPRAAVPSLGTVTPLNPDESPTVTTTVTDGDVAYNFGLPDAASFTVTDNVVSPNINPSVATTVTDGDVGLDFSLPRAAAVTVDALATVLNPDQQPSVGTTTTDGDVEIAFSLPRASTVSVGSVVTVSNETPAAVTDSGSDGDVVLDFDIPAGGDNIFISDTPPSNTDILWADTSEDPAEAQLLFGQLLDVDFSTPPVGNDLVAYNGTSWVPSQASIANLSDVSGSPSDGEVLVYNGTSGDWEPGDYVAVLG